MGYSNSYQSNIGTTPSLDAGFVNLTVNNAVIRTIVEPEFDDTIDIGRASKRFRAAYVDEIYADRMNKIIQYSNNNNSVPGKSVSSIIDSVPTRICVTEPSSRGTSGGIQMRSQSWSTRNHSNLFPSAVLNFSKYIPELKKWFAIPLSAATQTTYYSINGGLTWMTGGTLPSIYITSAGGDLAYSPRLRILVCSTANANPSGISIPTFYSADEGLTWTQCTFPAAPTNQIGYGRILWVAKYNLFLAFATISTTSQNSRGLFSIMKSSDGINFTATSVSLPSQLTAFDSTTRGAIFSADVDQSRGIVCVGIRNTNNLTESAVLYTEDGNTWVPSNFHKISIRDNANYSKNGVFLAQNNTIDFIYGAGTYACTIAAGIYDIATLLTTVATAMNTAASSGTIITVTQNTTTGIITVSFVPSTGRLMFLTGANESKSMCKELGFTKIDTLIATTAISTEPLIVGRGFKTHIAYSPPLDIWVAAGSNIGTITSSNIAWSDNVKDNNDASRPNGFWYQPAIPRQAGGGTPIPQFQDCKWIESFQMFFLLNGTPNYGGNVSADRSIWFSRDGINFYTSGSSSGLKVTTSTVELSQIAISFDDDNKVMIVTDGSAISTDLLNICTFTSLLRQSVLTLPSWQAGVFVSPAVINGSQTWTVTFDKPFQVAPIGVIATPTSATNGAANFLTWFITSITTTGFTIVATNIAGGPGDVQTFSYMAWERS